MLTPNSGISLLGWEEILGTEKPKSVECQLLIVLIVKLPYFTYILFQEIKYTRTKISQNLP